MHEFQHQTAAATSSATGSPAAVPLGEPPPLARLRERLLAQMPGALAGAWPRSGPDGSFPAYLALASEPRDESLRNLAGALSRHRPFVALAADVSPSAVTRLVPPDYRLFRVLPGRRSIRLWLRRRAFRLVQIRSDRPPAGALLLAVPVERLPVLLAAIVRARS